MSVQLIWYKKRELICSGRHNEIDFSLWRHLQTPPQKGKSIILPKCLLIGQLTKPFVEVLLGVTGSFVVRFQPNVFLPFATIPIKEMETKAMPLDKLFGKDGEIFGEFF